jgi:hypothetical protein
MHHFSFLVVRPIWLDCGSSRSGSLRSLRRVRAIWHSNGRDRIAFCSDGGNSAPCKAGCPGFAFSSLTRQTGAPLFALFVKGGIRCRVPETLRALQNVPVHMNKCRGSTSSRAVQSQENDQCCSAEGMKGVPPFASKSRRRFEAGYAGTGAEGVSSYRRASASREALFFSQGKKS